MVKKQSIASFIEKLPMDGSVGDCESTLLMTNLDFLGRGTNDSKCTNASISACTDSENAKYCINYSGACDNAKNKFACQSWDLEPKPLPNSLCGEA